MAANQKNKWPQPPGPLSLSCLDIYSILYFSTYLCAQETIKGNKKVSIGKKTKFPVLVKVHKSQSKYRKKSSPSAIKMD